MQSPRLSTEEQEEEGEAGAMQKDGLLSNCHGSAGKSRCLGSHPTLPHPSLGHALLSASSPKAMLERPLIKTDRRDKLFISC